jgi:hypothetical protein
MQVNLHTLAESILAALLLVAAATIFVRTLIYSLGLPRCWKCGAPKVRRSARRGVVDTLALVFLLVPYRCRGCRIRFYGIRTHLPLA